MTQGGPDGDPSKTVKDHAETYEQRPGSTNESTSVVATKTKGGKKEPPPLTASEVSGLKNDQDNKFSLAMAAPHASSSFPPTPSPKPPSKHVLCLDTSNSTQHSATQITDYSKNGSFSEEKPTVSEYIAAIPNEKSSLSANSNKEEKSHHCSPGVVSVQGRSDKHQSVDDMTMMMDDVMERQNTIKMDEEPASSLIVAAELVHQYDEEAPGFVPGGNIWEKKVQEEVETRLQNLAVAEVVTKDPSGRNRRKMMCFLLLTLVVLVSAIVTGVALGTNKEEKEEDSDSSSPRQQPQVIENKGQKQDRLRKELTQRINRTNSSEDLLVPFEDSSSPQSLALQWLLNDNITLTENTVSQKVLDRYVFAILYYSTDGPNWEDGSNFLMEYDICKWNNGLRPTEEQQEEDDDLWAGGVYCQGTQNNELLIYLNEGSLNGTLPWELSLLSNVVSLQLIGNALVGTIPPEIYQLSSLLELVVYNNSLTGTMPSLLGQLTKLEWLAVNDNFLTGTFPTELGYMSTLESLMVRNNFLSGTVPTEIGLLTKLQSIFVDTNTLTGTIPTELGLLKELQYLFLDSNTLTGTIPTELGLLTDKLQYLFVNMNKLTGTIPTELGLLTDELQYLYANNNTLSGTLPPELFQLTSLLSLMVYNNSLTGTLPTHLANLTNLEFLFVDGNKLTGTIPTELGQLTALMGFHAYNNSLTGTLVTQLGRLMALQDLKLNKNSLTGTLPTELGRLINLLELYVDNNKLTGRLPTELGRLTALSELRLFNNSLTGTLPTEMNRMVSLEALDLSNNLLTGTIPSELAENLGTNFSFQETNLTDEN